MSNFRPGSDEAKRFFESDADSKQWTATLAMYDEAISILSKTKGKPELPELDLFWRRKLTTAVQARNPPRLTQDELSKVMKWKLTRGKFRPLQKLCDSNGEKSVSTASEHALKYINEQTANWKSAMKSLTALHGIGEATASAILAPFSPDQCPFMADEVLDVTCGRREYTSKAYEAMRTALQQKARELGPSWTAEDVGKAVWTKAILSAYGPSNVDGQAASNTAKALNGTKKSRDVSDSLSDEVATKRPRRR
jgi:hypothetical protein